ncbi:RluA family pseudouridine synthase [Oceanobacillus jeddahense]|uniref:Pseudouridine synthase n=1 Tax=Oceanobacillus jeddahense TaxID=1462527 RepID=A0ABY5JX23_9BACI|nr:RluA family pseudouridine synthase [Oceanobacillus jeddahense]UUI04679.1 RluA family pseudouridine synthase [Oceanobacillus jeddahense]
MKNKKRPRSKKTAPFLTYEVTEAQELFPFLREVLANRSRNSVKSILTRGQVSVNDRIQTQHNYMLEKGQIVKILKNKEAVKQEVFIGMSIVYEDEDIIVIDKEAGLLSIATKEERRQTAFHQLMDYVKQDNPMGRIFVVHRLDKETSGVMVFAKSEEVKRKLQNNWKNIVKERTYVALVEGRVQKEKGYIVSWLKESPTHKMYSSRVKNDGQRAATRYRVIQSNQQFSLVELELETGRKNQIRVHMQELGHPVVGDKKYGGGHRRMIGRLGLHAKALALYHPSTNKLMFFRSDVPKSFYHKSK